METTEPVTIVLVEDDPGHMRLIEKNLRRGGIPNDIVKLQNGLEAMDYLFQEGEYAGQKLPAPILVLLDLNMPVMDGYEVLNRVKQDPATNHLPIIVLTTTDAPSEIEKCYELGCNVYIKKPVDYRQFAKAIQDFGSFVQVVSLPLEYRH